MSLGEEAYLAMVVIAFVIFTGVLFRASWNA